MKLLKKFEKNPIKWLWLMVAGYIFLLSVFSILKYYFFLYEGVDLAIFNQVFWNTIHGYPFQFSVTYPHSYLGDHFGIGLLLLLPIYTIFPHPITLLVMQSAVLGLAAFPLFFIGKFIFNKYQIEKSRLTPNTAGLLASLLWLLNPFVHSANLHEFHLLTLFPFFLFITIYGYLIKSKKIFLIGLVLSITLREDMSFIMAGLLIFIIIDCLIKKIKTKKKIDLFFIIAPTIAIIIWFLTSYGIINYLSETGDTKYSNKYSWLGNNTNEIFLFIINNPSKIIKHIFSFRNLNVFIGFFLPFAFVPILKPRWIFLATMPIIATALLNPQMQTQIIFYKHYILLIIPGFFLATFEGIIWSIKKSSIYKIIIIISVFVALIHTKIIFTQFPFKDLNYFLETISYRRQTWQEVKKYTKTNYSIMTNSYLLPKMSSRRYVYDIRQILRGEKESMPIPRDLSCNIDIVVVDNSEISHLLAEEKSPKLPFTSFSHIQDSINCSPIKNYYYPMDIYFSYDIDSRNRVEVSALENKIKNININQSEKNLTISGEFTISNKIAKEDLFWRVEIFDEENEKGLAILAPLVNLNFTNNKGENDENKINIKITSTRFLKMLKEKKQLKIYLVDNVGNLQRAWLDTAKKHIEKPLVVYSETFLEIGK